MSVPFSEQFLGQGIGDVGPHSDGAMVHMVLGVGLEEEVAGVQAAAGDARILLRLLMAFSTLPADHDDVLTNSLAGSNLRFRGSLFLQFGLQRV